MGFSFVTYSDFIKPKDNVLLFNLQTTEFEDQTAVAWDGSTHITSSHKTQLYVQVDLPVSVHLHASHFNHVWTCLNKAHLPYTFSNT